MNTQVVQWLKKAGFKGQSLRTMYGIVMRESGGDPHAYNGKGNDRSYGLTQINMLGAMGPARRRTFKLSSNDDLFDPMVNLRAAYRLSKGGTDFGPWGIGPNAYREGAGIPTIQKYLDDFDRAGPVEIDAIGSVPGNRQPTPRQSRQRLQDFDHRGLALRSLASLAAGDYDPLEGLSEMISARKAFESRKMKPTQPQQPQAAPSAPQRPGEGINLATRAWKETAHAGGRTSGLGWGDDEPMDIMGAPGTPVGAPANGVVIDHGTAQEGGLSVTILGDDGYEYWLGHIEQLPPIGSKIKAGQTAGVISGKHPRPHVHATRRRRR